MRDTPPILLIAYRRADTTARVFEAIRSSRPRRLYIAVNAPSPTRPADSEMVANVKQVVDEVDWPCKVSRLYRSVHLQVGESVSSAITWFFEHEPEGIILEDDCLPDPSFFSFCSELLERYRDETNVMQVAGFNPLGEPRAWASDYVFSQYGWQWGWATWRRAWQHFDLAMSSWPDFKRTGLHRGANFWPARVAILDKTFRGDVGTWDYQWAFAMAARWGLSAVPRVSLIQNIGLGEGTHYQGREGRPTATALAGALGHPLRHPNFIVPDPEFDRALVARHSPQHVVRRVLRRLRGMVGGPS